MINLQLLAATLQSLDAPLPELPEGQTFKDHVWTWPELEDAYYQAANIGPFGPHGQPLYAGELGEPVQSRYLEYVEFVKDDAPELTGDWFERAQLHFGDKTEDLSSDEDEDENEEDEEKPADEVEKISLSAPAPTPAPPPLAPKPTTLELKKGKKK